MLEISGQRERHGRKAGRELVHCFKNHRTLNNIKHPMVHGDQRQLWDTLGEAFLELRVFEQDMELPGISGTLRSV